MKTWKLATAISVPTLAACFGLYVGIIQMFYHLGKFPTHAVVYAAEIAIGISSPKTDYGARWRDDPEWNRFTCGGGKTRHYHCVVLGHIHSTRGCPWLYIPSTLRDCFVLSAHAYLLTDLDKLAKTLDAVRRPCRYLPTPAQIKANRKMSERDKRFFNHNFKEARCDTHPKEYPGRIIIRFHDSKRRLVLEIVKPAID